MFFPYPFPSITKKRTLKKLSSHHQSCKTTHILFVLFFCRYFTGLIALCIENVSHLAVWKRQLFFPLSESWGFTNKGSLVVGKQGCMLGDEQFGEAERIQCEVQWPYLSFSLLPENISLWPEDLSRLMRQAAEWKWRGNVGKVQLKQFMLLCTEHSKDFFLSFLSYIKRFFFSCLWKHFILVGLDVVHMVCIMLTVSKLT